MAKELSIDNHTARTILVNEGWNEDVVIRKHRLEGSQFLRDCRVTLNATDRDGSGEIIECEICLEDLPEHELYGLRCGHRFCGACWTECAYH